MAADQSISLDEATARLVAETLNGVDRTIASDTDVEALAFLDGLEVAGLSIDGQMLFADYLNNSPSYGSESYYQYNNSLLNFQYVREPAELYSSLDVYEGGDCGLAASRNLKPGYKTSTIASLAQVAGPGRRARSQGLTRSTHPKLFPTWSTVPMAGIRMR